MGACFSKSESRSRKGSLPPRPVSPCQRIYTPRSKTTVLLCYDLTDSKLRETTVAGIPEFQEGTLTACIGDAHLLCVGGVTELPSCFVVDLARREGTTRAPPPQPLAYGQLHVQLASAYISVTRNCPRPCQIPAFQANRTNEGIRMMTKQTENTSF